MSDGTRLGSFVWYELMTTDTQGAKDFYTRLIGWGTQAWEGGPSPYTMWTNKENPLGGVMSLPEEARKAGAPPHWLAYIGTPKVDDTVSQAQKLGARVMVEPTDIPNAGRFAVLSDPQGAVFGVYTSASQPPAHKGPPEVGEFSWHELMTTDHEAALRFYQALFGWEKLNVHDMGPIGAYVIYGLNGSPLGGMFNTTADMPPPNFVLYVRVSDVHPLAEKAKELGGRVLNGPMEVPGGDHIVQLMDPQGAMFALHSLARKS